MHYYPPPCLWIVIPCYNEESVLPLTAPLFLSEIESLASSGIISSDSRICLVDDGSTDCTWRIISGLVESSSQFVGVALSRNYGHQNALLCGLMEAKSNCDIAISIDCDGQDDIHAIRKMIALFEEGSEIVYGVRSARTTDTWFKRMSAEMFYRAMNKLGANVIFNHADYRLLSKKALNELSKFDERNLFLRGLIPLIGLPSSTVDYERTERIAGKSHYPLKKMLHLAADGITSLSTKPIHFISIVGILFGCIGILGLIWTFVTFILGNSVTGWTSTLSAIFMLGGLQLLSLGIIGEYVGKLYLESKKRPRYIVKERKGELGNE